MDQQPTVGRIGECTVRLINRALLRAGYVLAPTPPSAKMLREHANISECHHPSRGGRTVAWMRALADTMDGGF